MAYFLKKTIRGNRLYLSIYESFYSPDTKNTRHKSFRSIGFVDSLISQGIDDPISFFQKEVDELNLKRNIVKSRNHSKQISDNSPLRYLGYVPLSKVINILDIEEYFHFMSQSRHFQFDLYQLFVSLIFARSVAPLSKFKTFHEVLPLLFCDSNFSYDQLLDGLEFLGEEYEKFIEILTVATNDNFHLDTSKSYFDCTNFYFEIDKESRFQKKGPSKENRKDPIVGMGLLLDSNMIPIGMKIYPGNESEKPVMREIIRNLKFRNNIQGRTIQVADKGLNCAANIIEAVNNGDGYLFSKSVKQLPETEKTWILLDTGYEMIYDTNLNPKYKTKSCIEEFTYHYTDKDGKRFTKTVKEKRVATYNYKLARKKEIEIDRMVAKAKHMKASQAKKEEYGESSRYVIFSSKDGGKVETSLNQKAIERDKKLAGYNLLVTSEIHMSDEEIYDTYHQLWQIEESFRIMKSELDARPVYLQKENSIIGHFLICYTTVLLERLLQFKILNNRYGASTIYDFMRKFTVVKVSETRYMNLLTSSEFITDLSNTLKFPLTNFYITDKQIKMMHTK